MTSNNYITILGWMTNLGLKGNELLVYAIIHGFSQDKESYFHGSLKYLTQWTGTTEQNIIDILKKLTEKGLLIKVVREGTTNLYKTVNPFEEGNNCINNCEDVPRRKRKVKTTPGEQEIISEVIQYLNEKTGCKYRTNSDYTNKLIIERLKDGYTKEDLKTVIDVKCEDWKDEASMRKYLRPQTLFGDKFENYINQIPVNKSSSYSINHTNTDTPIVREISTTKVY